MNVANCTKCGKIFQRTNSPFCPTCFQDSVSNVSQVYRYIQSRPEAVIDDVASALGVPVKEIEQMIIEGKLGTAAGHLKSHCHNCETLMVASRGRFCTVCADKMEHLSKQIERAAEEKPTHLHHTHRAEDEVDSERHRFSHGSGNKLYYPDFKGGSAGAPKTDKPAGGQPYGFKRVSDDV